MAYWIDIEPSNRAPKFEFDDDLSGKLLFGLSLGLPVSAHRVPRIAREITEKKKYPDIFTMPGVNAVGHRFKQLVEEFEPGVHQFFPLELFTKDGVAVGEQYFVFNCTVSFDSLLVNKSDVKWLDLENEKRCPRIGVCWGREITLSSEAISGRHIWQSFRITTQNCILVSDDFYSEMKRRRITFFDHFHCKESDEPWVASENVFPILEWESVHGLEPGMKPWLLENPGDLN